MGYIRVLRIVILVVILVFPVIPVSAQEGEELPACPEGFIFVPSEYVGEGQCLEITYLPDGSLPLFLSVGGVLVSECPLYLTPGFSLPISLYAGYDLRVTGINAAGTFYQIVPFDEVPIRFWMPVSCIAPNPDQYWFERPLPTNVVVG